MAGPSHAHLNDDPEVGRSSSATGAMIKNEAQHPQGDQHTNTKSDVGFRRIIRNFTPSYVHDPIIIIKYTNQIDFLVVGS